MRRVVPGRVPSSEEHGFLNSILVSCEVGAKAESGLHPVLVEERGVVFIRKAGVLIHGDVEMPILYAWSERCVPRKREHLSYRALPENSQNEFEALFCCLPAYFIGLLVRTSRLRVSLGRNSSALINEGKASLLGGQRALHELRHSFLCHEFQAVRVVAGEIGKSEKHRLHLNQPVYNSNCREVETRCILECMFFFPDQGVLVDYIGRE